MSQKLFTIVRMLLGIPLNLIYILANLVPKSRDLWLFSAWQGRKYLDNPKYIYRFICAENFADIRPYWVTKDRKLYVEMRLQGLPVEYGYSLRGLILQLRAAIVVFTHSVEWEYIPFLIAARVKRVQTWHGMPVKKIGYDDSRLGNPRLKAKILAAIFPYQTDRCDLVIAGGDADKSKYATAFNVDAGNIRITGYPRNDEIVRTMQRRDEGGNAKAGIKKVIYMPTFRGAVGSEFDLLRKFNFDFSVADAVFEKLQVDFYIKLHPVQIFSDQDMAGIRRSSRVHALGNDGDIYENIGSYDVLVTDFSGIYFDFLITGKPIIMAPFDLDTYLKDDRQLYYAYEDICPDTPCVTWHEVFERIGNLVDSGGTVTERYRHLQKSFHTYLDGNSACRVVVETRKLARL